LLNKFKELEISWTYSDVVLTNSNNIFTKIIMLGILEDNIKQKWNVVSEEDKLGIRNFLITILLKCVNENTQNSGNSHTHFINKLNNVIVAVNYAFYYI
jgi:exportin-1